MNGNIIHNHNSAEYIKAQLIDFFISELDDLVIGNEVMYGIKRKVVDLLILNQERLTAIEIKGDNDDLRRIQEQIEEYKKIFNYIIICTTENHLKKLQDAIPCDIGIYLIHHEGIKIKRRPKLQKHLDKKEILYTINTKYLKENSEIKLYKLNSDEVRSFYSKKSLDKIQKILYSYLYSKIEMKYKFFLSDRGNITHIDDIPLLSSYFNLK